MKTLTVVTVEQLILCIYTVGHKNVPLNFGS